MERQKDNLCFLVGTGKVDKLHVYAELILVQQMHKGGDGLITI
mgnify:CR=1 FL=1